MVEVALGRRGADITVLEIGLDRLAGSLGGPPVARSSRCPRGYDIAWHEVQFWRARGSDGGIVRPNPAQTPRRAAGNALRGVAGPSGRPGEGKGP